MSFTGTRRSAWEIAEAWYREPEIAKAIERSGNDDFGAWPKIPDDVRSPEFAAWFTHQIRLAMAKGVQLGRNGSEDYPSAERQR